MWFILNTKLFILKHQWKHCDQKSRIDLILPTCQILLLIQFMAMILDRIIYLHRSMLAKYIYQIVLVGVVHVYMFIFQPWLTNE